MSEETTVTEKKVTVQIKENPRDMYYMRGTSTRDYLKGQLEALNAGYEEPDPVKVREFFETLRVGDTVGIAYTGYKVEEINIPERSLTLLDLTKHKRDNPVVELGLDEIGFAIACGFAEILYRDDKPYGIELEKEYTIKVVKRKNEEETDNGTDEEAEGDS